MIVNTKSMRDGKYFLDLCLTAEYKHSLRTYENIHGMARFAFPSNLKFLN